MTAAAGRPLDWNVLTIDAAVPERVPRQLAPAARAREAGGRVVATDHADPHPDEHVARHLLPRAGTPTSSSSTRSGSTPDRPGSCTTQPGDSPRLDSRAQGIVGVRVNGVDTVRDDAITGAVPGTVLCSGRVTRTVSTR